MALSPLLADKRFQKAVDLFNSEDWYPAHDAFEELWHETFGSERITLQAFLQIAVAQLHLESGNINGATILFGEALGRLTKLGAPDLGFDIGELSLRLENRLTSLQHKRALDSVSPLLLRKKV